MERSRREYISLVCTAGAIGVAGCGGDSGDNELDPDANPRHFLPAAPEGWEIDTNANQQAAGLIGAEAGYSRSFDGPNDAHYAVEFYRFPSETAAEDEASVFETSGWSAYVVRGNFAFAGRGPDLDSVYLMLGNSPALTEEYARNNNIF